MSHKVLAMRSQKLMPASHCDIVGVSQSACYEISQTFASILLWHCRCLTKCLLWDLRNSCQHLIVTLWLSHKVLAMRSHKLMPASHCDIVSVSQSACYEISETHANISLRHCGCLTKCLPWERSILWKILAHLQWGGGFLASKFRLLLIILSESNWQSLFKISKF